MSAVVILAIGAALVLILPLASRVARRRFDPFEPIVVFALAWGVMFVVRPIAIVIRDDRNFYGVDIRPTLDKAMLLGLLGAVAFVVGHEARSTRRLTLHSARPPGGELTLRALPYAALVGVLATSFLVLFLLWAGGPDAIETFLAGRSEEFNNVLRGSPLYLWTFSLAVVPAALVGFALAWVHPRPGVVAVAVVLVALAFLRTVPTGDRIYILMLVGGATVFLYLHHAKRPGVVAIAVGLTAALVGSYAFLFFRYAETRESLTSALEGIANTPSRVFQPLITRPDSEMAPALAGALQVIPSELSHRYGGATLGDLIARPIPRHVWEGKPQPHVLVVTERVWPVARQSGSFQPNFTPLLSFYWDFGLVGVFVGMALYGWLARLAYRYVLREAGTITTQLLYALILWTVVVAVRADPVLLTFHLLVMVGPLFGIAWLGSREARRESAPTGAM